MGFEWVTKNSILDYTVDNAHKKKYGRGTHSGTAHYPIYWMGTGPAEK